MSGNESVLWLNGVFLPAGAAAISPLDRGFLYGDGVFETIRAEKGRALYLQRHLKRFAGAVSFLRIGIGPEPDWEAVIFELLRENSLLERTAAVKILATRGTASDPGLPDAPPERGPTVLVAVRPYDPPAPEVYEKGWRLHIFREGFSPPLAHIKSLNYLYFLVARQAAADSGADEAVILDPRGQVTETAAGSLLVRTDGKWWTPKSRFQLPGITLEAASEILGGWGHAVERRAAGPEDLLSAETVWVLNSLIGVMPVSRIGDTLLPVPAPEEAARMRAALFERG